MRCSVRTPARSRCPRRAYARSCRSALAVRCARRSPSRPPASARRRNRARCIGCRWSDRRYRTTYRWCIAHETSSRNEAVATRSQTAPTGSHRAPPDGNGRSDRPASLRASARCTDRAATTGPASRRAHRCPAGRRACRRTAPRRSNDGRSGPLQRTCCCDAGVRFPCRR